MLIQRISRTSVRVSWVSLCMLGLAACGRSSDSAPPPPDSETEGPAAPATGADAISTFESSRFLTQATFGPSGAEIQRLRNIGMSAWLQAEFAKPQESLLQEVLLDAAGGQDVGPDQLAEAFWTRAVLADDQLRQRVGYALSQILVASYADSQLAERPVAMANYMDIMAAGAFGNFRQTLENVTYSPAMAIYLTYLQNQKADEDREVVPDENYAREVMQLFTIGLLELQQNGEPRLDSGGDPIETYDNGDITELAKVFTGLSWASEDNFFSRADRIESEYLPLVMYDEQHSPEAKSFLNTTIPPNTPGDRTIEIALDVLFNHANTAPFISKQLIQRLVTSNPSPEYVERIADVFDSGVFQLPNGQNAGNGQRGDMRAVVAAILLDAEARGVAVRNQTGYGKIREPVLRFTHWARAFGVRRTDIDDIDELQNTSAPSRLNQQAYRSPSVFNFYRPGFVSPGSESGAAGFVAPELQITTASSVTGYANFMEQFIAGEAEGANFAPNYSNALNFANDPAALVDHLDTILTFGALSATTRSRTVDAVSSITSGDSGFTRDERRVHAAILLLMTSPDYVIVR